MHSTDDPRNPREPGPAAPLALLERTLRADVEEARAIEPLIEQADSVHGRIRRGLGRVAPLLGLLVLGAILVGSGLYRELTIENLAAHHDDLLAWVATHPVLATMGLPGALALSVCPAAPCWWWPRASCSGSCPAPWSR